MFSWCDLCCIGRFNSLSFVRAGSVLIQVVLLCILFKGMMFKQAGYSCGPKNSKEVLKVLSLCGRGLKV